MRRLNIASGFQRGIRALVIWRGVLTLLLLLWWDGQAWTYRGGATPERRAERQKKRAQWLTHQLLELGSAFIKLGQLLSSRPDILPAGWVSELASLQDNVPAFGFDRVQTVLEEELGQRCAEVIDLDPQPLGAASLAQVHRASLRSGRQVVLKVQRQGLDRRFRLDLDVMQQVAAVLQRHPSWGRGRDWPAMARECRRVLLRELDFRVEAQYAARFRQQFLDDERIRIPGVIWELSTRRVLCLDYLPGIKINDREAIVEAGIDPSDVAEIGAASYLKQLVRFGFFSCRSPSRKSCCGQ
jgi:predicted unusual protein kinase regulating ubiquinone biosynthesis (AarF/ABC1/UbiB family)